MSSTVEKISGELHMRPELRKSFNLLKTHASKVANFTLQWQDLEEHFLSIDNSIQSKLDQLQKQQSKETHLTPTLQSQPSFKETELDFHENSKETEFNPTDPQPSSRADSKDTQLTATLQSLKAQFNFVETQVKTGESLPESSSCNGVPIHDGKALLLYLNEHLKERDSVRDLIANALKVSVDAGKLVLEAVRWFYPSESSKGDGNLELTVVRKSCVLLLEELMKVRPVIKPEISQEAMKLALVWKAKVRGQTTNSLEVWGYLQLLGAFGLVGEFDSDETLKLVGCIAERKWAPELFRSLGFANRATDFIQKLVSENKRLDAIRFIHAFEQLDKFSPVPLLKEHLKFAKKDVSCKRGQDHLSAQDEAREKEIVALRGIIRCIDDYKLRVEPQYSPETLRKRITLLRRQRKERKATLTAPDREAQVQHLSGKKRTAPDSKTQPNKQNRNKHQRTAPASAARNASFREPATGHSVQPSYLQQVGLFESRGTEYFLTSAGMPGQATTPPNTSYGTTSTFNSLRASHHQQGGSFLGQGAEYSAGYYDSAPYAPDTHNNLPARSYGLVGSSPVTHTQHLTARDYGLSSAIASYGLEGSGHASSHMSPLATRYGTSIAANGRSGQFGSAGSPPPVRITSRSPNSSIAYVSRDPVRMPNYNDRSVSSSSGYGTLSQCPPSIYHL
ncbi:PREDICTED: FRIGIDA [Prunus dulcis]|uniref:FRIGIDA-like protein n=1 Tax=Prunus dulcis TaxID=3755 RepID=A0A5E4EBN8_PRUDU|nr:FRIGIDA-like protein 3 [Prunus dulcis]VVA12806.1 PREDICTED: FRIGIDA [Prunus dulcis]